MRRTGLLVIGVILLLFGVVGLIVTMLYMGRWESRDRVIGGLPTPPEFETNGERIYFTATSESGLPITFSGGPHWFRMHGGSCVHCHGPDGRGGRRIPMTNKVATDTRYSALISDHHDDHGPYTEALIRRAIIQGLDPDGEPLDLAMPRCNISGRDMDDLIDHLRALDGS